MLEKVLHEMCISNAYYMRSNLLTEPTGCDRKPLLNNPDISRDVYRGQ